MEVFREDDSDSQVLKDIRRLLYLLVLGLGQSAREPGLLDEDFKTQFEDSRMTPNDPP